MGKASYNVNSDDKINNNNNNNLSVTEIIDDKPEVSTFRRILPQILAVSAKNLLLFDLGLSVAIPTIVIPALRGISGANENETLHFTDVQASWFGSIAFICQPIGSILSGWVTEPLGRKNAMIIVNIPHIIAWTLLHYANSLEAMYIGGALLGLGVGFMEAPIITYVGEICEPSVRGILISCAGVAVTLGIFIVYLLGSIALWRNVALMCLVVPLTTIIAICFIPETPMWLLSKNRTEDARKSLQWLRGWVTPKAIEKEFQEIQRYNLNSTKCHQCQKVDIKCMHPPAGLIDKLIDLKRKRTLKPFFIITTLFAIGQFSGILAMRPFMVQVFKAYNVPVDPQWATVCMGVVGLLANIVCVSTIKTLGKRKICLIGVIGSLICCIGLATYGQIMFPNNYNSFDNNINIEFNKSYFPLIAFFFLAFWTNGGVTSTPWFMLSEVFPFKTRGLATGIVAALNYGFQFIATKTYLNLDKELSLNGTMWFYTSVNVIGLFFVYFLIPETENRTLEDIEMHFSDNKKKITNIKIDKISLNNKLSKINKENNGQLPLPPPPPLIEEVIGCDNKAFAQ